MHLLLDHRIHALTVVLMAAVLQMASPLPAAASTNTSYGGITRAQPHRVLYDGQTLFRGLFLHEGPVAQRHPDLAMTPSPPSAQVDALITRIMSRMQTLDPQFFGRFAAGLQSGNRVKIMQTLQATQSLFQRAMIVEFGPPTTRAVTPGRGQCIALVLVIVLVGAVLLLVVLAGAAVVAAAGAVVVVGALFKVFFWGSASAPGQSRLAQEMWVNRLAPALAA